MCKYVQYLLTNIMIQDQCTSETERVNHLRYKSSTPQGERELINLGTNQVKFTIELLLFSN